MERIVITGAVRTAIGKYSGTLTNVPAQQLGAAVIRESLKRSGLPSEAPDEVLMGCVIQAGLGQNVSRQASLLAGLPESTPAMTINLVCGSSLQCVTMGAALIRSAQADVVVAGGMENMSAAPYVLDKARFGYRMNNGTLKDAMVYDALWDAMNDCHMGVTAENIAAEFNISRREQDEFAAESQQKCEAARKGGLFSREIVPVTVKTKKEELIFDTDESPRDQVTAESLANLKPAFLPEGTVSAGNSSSVNDGAAALILMTEEKAREFNVKIEAYYIDGALAGVSPKLMGLGAGKAARGLFKKTGYGIDDMTLVEANEAFASQSIACARIGGWEGKNMEKVNVNGGAIALGHPVGASGCRILVTLLHELNRRGGGKGLATLCVGGGMGVAAMVEVKGE
jgi:acetyl-CoA C-acetyltransferase